MQGEEEMGGLDQSSRGGEKAEAGAEVVEEGEEEVVLPGFRFHPTDEELIGFYLRRKVDNKHTSIELIKQIDIYKYDPWDLPKVSTGGEKEWYFFCLRGRKYRNSIRPNRVTGSGFWKATGIDRPIYSAASGGNSGDCIGLKKSLVYYRGSAGKGTKTDWMMHEFRLPPNSPSIQEAEIWTICRILKRNATNKKYTQVWKGSNSKRIPIPTDSSSFESDARDTYNGLGASAAAAQQGEKPAAATAAASYFEESNKYLLADQWNPTSALHPSIPTPIANELYKDGNWDELGRIMEYMMDPGLVYGCRYP